MYDVAGVYFENSVNIGLGCDSGWSICASIVINVNCNIIILWTAAKACFGAYGMPAHSKAFRNETFIPIKYSSRNVYSTYMYV